MFQESGNACQTSHPITAFAACIAALHNYISGEVCVKARALLGCRGKNQAERRQGPYFFHRSPLPSSSPPPFYELQANSPVSLENACARAPTGQLTVLITVCADTWLPCWSRLGGDLPEVSVRERKSEAVEGGGKKRWLVWHGQMGGQWSVTGPAAHTLTQRDCQIAGSYN